MAARSCGAILYTCACSASNHSLRRLNSRYVAWESLLGRSLSSENLWHTHRGTNDFYLARRTVATKKDKDAKSSEKKAADETTPQVPSDVLATRCVGANINKEGEDPVLLSDGEYPQWLFTLLDNDPAAVGEKFGPEQKTLWRRYNKEQNRQRNFEKSQSK